MLPVVLVFVGHLGWPTALKRPGTPSAEL
jgi:NAD(P)-dependent dehydrogenase (short-subunit alcohol dehydrogenase family)